MRTRIAVLGLAACMVTSACAGSYRAPEGADVPDIVESTPAAVVESTPVAAAAKPPAGTPAKYSARKAAEKTAETPAPLRRPDAAYARRQAFQSPPVSSGAVVEIPAKSDGMKIVEVFALIERETGKSILYDDYNAVVKSKKVKFIGDRRIYKSDLMAWAQAVLYQKGLALTPVGPLGADGERQWVAVDQASAVLAPAAHVPENDLPKYAVRDGLLITSTLAVLPALDVPRIRTALSQFSTKTAGIGRINDMQDANALVVQDFAPIVARMRQMLDEIEIAHWEAAQQR